MSLLTISSGQRKPNTISVLACFAFLCIGTVPAVYGLLAGRYLTLAYAVLLCIWIAELAFVHLTRGRTGRMLALVLVYILMLVVFAALNIFNFRGYLISVAVPLFPILAYSHYADYEDTKPLQTMAVILLVLLGVTFVTTVIGLDEEKYLLRVLPTLSVNERLSYYRRNIGSINHIYTAGLVLVTYFSKLKQLRKTSFWIQLVALLIAVAAFLLVIKGSSGITVLACVVGLVWFLLSRQKPAVRYILVIVLVFILLAGMDTLADGLKSLSQKVDNYYFSNKLADMAASLQGGEAMGDVAARTDGYKKCLETFIGSYGLGVGPQYGQVYAATTVDGHSQLLADLARYGILWLVGVITVSVDFVKSIKQHNKAAGIEVDNGAVYATFLMMFAMQPALSNIEITAFMFMIMPFLDGFLQRKAQR